MKTRRLELHEKLCDILGSRHCYYRPPESVKLKYPCIVYDKRTGDSQYADNGSYIYEQSYDVTVIDHDPDSEIGDKIIKSFQMCRADRSYAVDNLYHNVYVLYY